jgi:hypothetical protein
LVEAFVAAVSELAPAPLDMLGEIVTTANGRDGDECP